MSELKRKYQDYKQLDLSSVAGNVLKFWAEQDVFHKSISNRGDSYVFTFYEGPPSANGMPGIHHVMARTIKDIFCRYKTLKGYKVERKGGWDTHGLPIELSVEKSLGITKVDIGKTISVEDYNKACRREVMKYKDVWDDLTLKMGYWLDLENPYITFDNKYIETVWYLLQKLYKKGLLYKGYTIQPYSPAAGTGLSSHELNQPGTYKMVKDTSVTAQFKIEGTANEYFLAWTTTPWTLPSNTALAIGNEIVYSKVETFNQYTFKRIIVYLAKNLLPKYFNAENENKSLDEYVSGEKLIPYKILGEVKGKELVGIRYERLLPCDVQPTGGDPAKEFRVIHGDFVTTEDGTGIVHISPSFGADDFRVAKLNGIGSLTLVDKQGKFVDEVTEFAGRYVKNYNNEDETKPGYETVDISIVKKLKFENKAFRVEKFEHSYPHCWRTDKPILYYPLDSWFVKTTACRDRLVELNETINWKPEFTGSGRFGNWLKNLVDWNLSRSRFWGIPLPIWKTEDGVQEKCIGSVKELSDEIEKSISAGFMKNNPLRKYIDEGDYNSFDLHKPYCDDVILVSDAGTKMLREPDLIDVWFDAGSMPYAQWHYPFENEENFTKNFPADFIAEGVDQTRGWFFTLHAIAVLLFDSVAFKNVISNGLVLDKNGNKMSKRLGNGVDPFDAISKYGADAVRWYLISNSQPWDDLKFNFDGVQEVQRKFFGTLFNTYAFFALYANIDGFKFEQNNIPVGNRPELDKWIISELNSLVKNVDESLADYEPTKAARAIQDFVNNHLSNWYVRLSRRRFWKGAYSEDKIAAYQTLYECLETVSILMSPIAPFYSEQLFLDLNTVSGKIKAESVHLADFPKANNAFINKDLEERMELAQKVSSMVLSLRKRSNIRVRQPLNRILIPIFDPKMQSQLESVKDLILSEVNVKEIEYISDTAGILVKKIKANFKKLGPQFGTKMKEVANAVSMMTQSDILTMEREGKFDLSLADGNALISVDDVEITSQDIPGWLVNTDGNLTTALDINITERLKEEGIARELVNRIQNIRKDLDFEITDRITLRIKEHNGINLAISNNLKYICAETLAESLEMVKEINAAEGVQVEVDENIETFITVQKI